MPPDCADTPTYAPPVERRQTQVLFKVTATEKQSYVAASIRSGVDLSKWIRAALDRASRGSESG